MKVCTGCKQSKPYDDFWRDKRASDGRTTRCVSCIREYREANREKLAEGQRAYRQANLERINARDKQAARDHPGRQHHITADQYQAMLTAQGGVCAVCGRPETKISRHGTPMRLAVDHDHACCPGHYSCGKCVRGLLCQDCNIAAGKLRDDPDVMLALAFYVLRGKSVLEVQSVAA